MAYGTMKFEWKLDTDNCAKLFIYINDSLVAKMAYGTGVNSNIAMENHNHDASYIARDSSISKLYLTPILTNYAMLTAIINGTSYGIPISGETNTGYVEHIAVVYRNNKRQLRIIWRQDGKEYISYLNFDESP